MKRIKQFGLLAIFLLIAPLQTSQALSPLRYQTHIVAVVEALVEEIRLVDISTLSPPEYPRERLPRSGEGSDMVQRISLKVLKVEKIELNRCDLLIREGDSIGVTNQYLDQKPSFAPGEVIGARIRLVVPEERCDPKDPRRQWWFFPEGESESILPPRLPFSGIRVVR